MVIRSSRLNWFNQEGLGYILTAISSVLQGENNAWKDSAATREVSSLGLGGGLKLWSLL